MKGNALIHAIKIFTGLKHPFTQTTIAERTAIQKMAAGALLAVEIGVYEGVNTVNIAKVLHESGRLLAIDPFVAGSLGLNYQELITKRHISKSKMKNKVILLKGFSYDLKNEVKDNEADFIFIDGDHSYEGIKTDWEDWLPKIKPNGVIALHDTQINSLNLGVENLGSYKFFHETIVNDPRVVLVETVDSTSFLQKKVRKVD